MRISDWSSDVCSSDLCLPGLTRNARDFEPVANRLAGQWRLICPEMRGRAESGYAKDPMTYVPLTYVQDIERLLAELGISRFVAFGTSPGGLIRSEERRVGKECVSHCSSRGSPLH